MKEFVKDWLFEFPELSSYGLNKLYKILGPFIIGIEIFKVPRVDVYRPIFVCYPLWKNDLNSCLDEPVFIEEIRTVRGNQFDIPYIKHKELFRECVIATRAQVPLLISRNIMLTEMFNTIGKQFSQTLIKNSPIGQAKLLEAKLFAASYVNDKNLFETVMEETFEKSKTWKSDLFEWKFGNINLWKNNRSLIFLNRKKYLHIINENKSELVKLTQDELIWPSGSV